MIELNDIRLAAERIAGKIHRTPLLPSRTLGEMADVDLFLKCECFQKTGSFKARGALNKILSLSKLERDAGLITVSAGNHAQAVAWAARQVGAPAVVVMPSDAPRSKVDAVHGYGAEVVSHDDRATLFDRVNEERESRGATFIHPFDDATLLAGAGTTGIEIIEDLNDVAAVIVPVGGGGQMAGVAVAVKALKPEVQVIAVELEAGPGLGPALKAGAPVTVSRPTDTVADGMTPPFVGALPLRIAKEKVDQVVTVTETEIIDAMRLLLLRCKLYTEGSGAATTAALIAGRISLPAGGRVAAIVSGGNVDLETICSRLALRPSA